MLLLTFQQLDWKDWAQVLSHLVLIFIAWTYWKSEPNVGSASYKRRRFAFCAIVAACIVYQAFVLEAAHDEASIIASAKCNILSHSYDPKFCESRKSS